MSKIKALLKKYNDIPVAAKATLWFVFCSTVQKAISLITVPIFTRLMTTEQYGQFTVYNSWVQIFTIITTLRLNWAVFNKGMSKYKEDCDGYTSTMQSLTFIITLGLFLIYLVFHEKINQLVELPTFIMVAMFCELMVAPAIDFWTVRTRYEYLYKPVVIRTLLMAFLNAVIGIAAVLLSEEKGYARILSVIFVNFVFGVYLLVYNYRKGKCFLNKEYAKFALSFNLPLLLHYISQYVLDQFDRIMIQKIVNIEMAGKYGVAYNAALLMKIITQSINNALVPWQYEQLEKKNFKKLDDTLFLIYIFVSCCAVFFVSCAPEIMRILADSRYYEAVYVIPPVAIGLVFLFMYTAFANVEFFYDFNRFTMYISMAGALLNIILNYIGIKLFGFVAAAYTTLFCYIVFSFSHYLYMSKCIEKKMGLKNAFDSKRLITLSFVLIIACISLIFLYDLPIIRYFIIAIIATLAFIFRDRIKTTLKATSILKSNT